MIRLHFILKKQFILTLFLLGFSLLIISKSQAQSSKENTVAGSLVIIGGALRYDNAPVWNKIIEKAGGKNASIAVIPAASGSPDRTGKATVENLNRYGAKAFLVPLSVKYQNTQANYQIDDIVKDPVLLQQLATATGVYFTGGDQGRITQALIQKDGKNTQMLDAIWAIYNKGGVIAGTSAGAAIMSSTMFYEAKSVLETLKLGVQDGKEIAPGLGFIGANVFIDQHLIIRGRFARMLPAMIKKSYQLGLGIDENTAIVVNRQKEIEIVGYKGAIVLNLSEATQNKKQKEFNVEKISISYLGNGDRMDLESKVITPAADKTKINKIVSEDADQNPTFTTNILANSAVVEVMSTLIESKKSKTIGLAFSDQNSVKAQLGFEFMFYKKPSSEGYFSSITGAEDFTIIDLGLNIRPVQIRHPIYK